MHGATAPKKELAPELAAWRDDLRKETSTASGGRRKKAALQDDGDSEVNAEDIEKRYGSLMRRLGRHPEFDKVKSGFLKDKLDLLRADLKTQSKLSSLPGRLDEINRQIDTLRAQKPLDKAGKEAALKWQVEVVAKQTSAFALKCNALTVELTNLAKNQAKELAKTASGDKKKQFEEISKASTLNLIGLPIESLRVRLSKDLMLEGQGKDKEVVARYEVELAAMKQELTAFVKGIDFGGAVRQEVQDKAAAAELSKQQADSAKFGQELDAARKEAQVSLAKLNDLGSILAPGYAKDLQEAKSAREVTALHAEIREKITAEQKGAKDRVSTHDKVAESVGKQLEKNISGQNDAAKAALKALQVELEQTKALAATGNPRAAEAASRLAAKIEAAAKDAINKDSAFSKLFTRITELQKLLADDTVTKFFDKEKQPLQKALDSLAKDADALDPAASQDTLAGLDKRIVDLKNRAKALSEWQDLKKKQLEALKGDMQKLMGGAVAALLRSDTKMSLLVKDIETAYQTPGVDQKAVNLMVDDLNSRIFKLRGLKDGKEAKKDDFKKGIEAEQKEAKDDIAKKEAAEKQKADDLKAFQSDHAKLIEDLKGTAKKVKDAKGSKEDVDVVSTLASTAETMAKNGEMKEAREKLKAAREKRDQLETNPGGYAVASVADLVKAPEQWKKAIAEATSMVEKVAAEAVTLSTRAGKTDASLKEKIAAASKVFDHPALFDAPLKIICDDKIKAEDRKAARERILRDVRQMRASMDASPMLQLVRRNPFPKMKQVTARIQEFLNTLELNTLRAIRPE